MEVKFVGYRENLNEHGIYTQKHKDATHEYIERPRRRPGYSLLLTVIGLFALSTVFSGIFQQPFSAATQDITSHALSKNAVTAATSLLQVFQVYPPVFTPFSQRGGVNTVPAYGEPSASSNCSIQRTLMKHVFANSYGQPFVANVVPPACNFNRVVFNVTFTAAGRQFDRLGSVYLGDIEVWRLSTAEPTQSGIVFSYAKDMTHYLSLFKTQQKLIFDLGNQITDIYTSPFNGTLIATYFSDDSTVVPADVIVPVSARQSSKNGPSAFQIPDQQALNTITLPRNINRAVFSLAATGQIDEEFWFGNVFNSEVKTFSKSGTDLLGYSPFREVQLYIDGLLAGVAWPFPIIFTGGVVPGFWRPIVGIDAFDLREDEIDITPWLPRLCNGGSHTFQIRVAGIDDDGKGHGALTKVVGSYWVVSGKIFLWSDPAGSVTTGSQFHQSVPPPTISLSSSIGKTRKGVNQTLTYDTQVSRQLIVTANVHTATENKEFTWSQNLTYTNHGRITAFGNNQILTQSTNGFDSSSRGYSRRISYPITVDTSYVVDSKSGNFSIDGSLTRDQDIFFRGQPVFPTGLQSFDDISNMADNYPKFQGTQLHTTQNGTAHYFSSGNGKVTTGSGETQQDLDFHGVERGTDRSGKTYELYRRHVLASNNTVREDNESLEGGPINNRLPMSTTLGNSQDFASRSIFRMLGRGPRTT